MLCELKFRSGIWMNLLIKNVKGVSMKTRLQILDDTYENNFVDVSVKFTEECSPFSIANSGHIVTVTRNGVQASFPFYGSVYKPKCTIEDIPDMIMCAISDMTTYADCNDYTELADQLGYSLEEARELYKELEKQYTNLITVFDTYNEIADYMFNQYV